MGSRDKKKQYQNYSDSEEDAESSSDKASANAGSSPEPSDDDEQASMSSHGGQKNPQNKQIEMTSTQKQSTNRNQKQTTSTAASKKRQSNNSSSSSDDDSDTGKQNVRQTNKLSQQTSQQKSRLQKDQDESVRKRDTSSQLKNAQQNDENSEESDMSDYDEDYEYNSDGEYVRKADRPKREQYDFTETSLKWIGFFVVVVFMWAIYYFMLSKGVGSTAAAQKAAQHKEQRTVSLDQPTSYPFDIEFKHSDYAGIKDTSDRIKSVRCTDEHPVYKFAFPAIPGNYTAPPHMKSFLDLKCTNCNSARMYEEEKRTHEFADHMAYEEMAQKFRCTSPYQVYLKHECEFCDENCHRCTPFSHHCYSCYANTVLLSNQTCGDQCDFDGPSAVEHFCIKPRAGMNLSVVQAADHNLFLLHTPPLIDIQVIEDEEDENTRPIALPEELGDNFITEEQQNPEPKKKKPVDRKKKYPMIVVLNDHQFTQQDVFLSKAISHYFDHAFVLSVPFLNTLPDAKAMHKILLNEIKALTKPELEKYIGAYGLVGFGITGQIVNEISLNQQDDGGYWQAKFMATTAISDTHFTSIISQNSHSFDSSIRDKDNYFKTDSEFQQVTDNTFFVTSSLKILSILKVFSKLNNSSYNLARFKLFRTIFSKTEGDPTLSNHKCAIMNASNMKIEEPCIYNEIITELPQQNGEYEQPCRSRVCSFKAGVSEKLEIIQRVNESNSSLPFTNNQPMRCKYRHIEPNDPTITILTALQEYQASFKTLGKIFLTTPEQGYDSPEIRNRELSGIENGIYSSRRSTQTQSLQDIRLLSHKETQFKNFIVKIFTNFLFRGKLVKNSPINEKQVKLPPSPLALNSGWPSNTYYQSIAQASPDQESNGASGSRANQQQSQYHNLKNSFMHLIIQVFSTEVLSCFDLDESIVKEMIAIIDRMKKHSFKYRPVKGRYQYYSNIHYSTLFLELNSAATLFEIQSCPQSKQFHDVFFEIDIAKATSIKDPAIFKCNFFKQLIGSVVSYSIHIAEQQLLTSLDGTTINSNRYTYISKVTKGIKKLQKGKHVIRF